MTLKYRFEYTGAKLAEFLRLFSEEKGKLINIIH